MEDCELPEVNWHLNVLPTDLLNIFNFISNELAAFPYTDRFLMECFHNKLRITSEESDNSMGRFAFHNVFIKVKIQQRNFYRNQRFII